MPEARLAMPFDPNFARNPLPPLNDGYPDDWHVPPSAQGDGFPDDWYVPESAAVPSASQPAPSAQPNAANPGFAGWPAPPPGSIAAYWARMAADRQRTAPWAPPMFPDAFGRFPPSPFAPTQSGLPTADALVPSAYLQSPPIAAAQGLFNGLAQPPIGSIDDLRNDSEYRLPVAFKKKGSMDPALFDERAFGTAPPYGSGAPRLVPPLGNPGPKPAAASPQSPLAQARPQQRVPPPAGQAQPNLPASRHRPAAPGSASSPGRAKEAPSVAVLPLQQGVR